MKWSVSSTWSHRSTQKKHVKMNIPIWAIRFYPDQYIYSKYIPNTNSIWTVWQFHGHMYESAILSKATNFKELCWLNCYACVCMSQLMWIFGCIGCAIVHLFLTKTKWKKRLHLDGQAESFAIECLCHRRIQNLSQFINSYTLIQTPLPTSLELIGHGSFCLFSKWFGMHGIPQQSDLSETSIWFDV